MAAPATRIARFALVALLLLARGSAAGPATLDAYERSAAAFADGLAFAERGLGDEASRSYLEAIQLDPGFVEAMVNLARIRLLHGELESAREWLDRALRLAPAYPPIHAVRGLMARARGDLQEALRAFSRARTLDPGNAEVLANLGTTLFELGLDEDARDVLEEARSRAPVRPEPVLTLALLWDRRGDRSRAAYFYGLFLGLVGTDDPARALARARLVQLDPTVLKRAAPASETVTDTEM